MSRKPVKEQLIEFCVFFGLGGVCDPSSSLMDHEEEETLAFVQLLRSKRYIMDRVAVPKTLHWTELAFFRTDYDDNRFRGQFRMNRDSFNQLIPILADNAVFNETQDPVQLQLGVGLFRLGSFGNAASIPHVATKFGVSEGSVVNFTDRVIAAITSLSHKWIQWPTQTERRHHGTEMALKGFPKCVGFVDGIDIDLSEAPKSNKEVYWSRKKKYCVQAQIVSDSRKVIRDLFIGYPGCVHDAKVFMTSPIDTRPEQFFSDGEFILGDSAYSLTDNVIVPFRKTLEGLAVDKKQFNYRLSEHRVLVENTIGLLKGRFQSLKGLRIRISDESLGHKRVCDWTHACAILHNMLVGHDPWEADHGQFEADEFEQSNEVSLVNLSSNKKGQLRRLALLQIHKGLH